MTQIGVLIYADWRAVINDLRRIRRSPGRLVLWSGYLIAIGLLAFSRMKVGHRVATSGAGAVIGADYLVTMILVTLIVSLAAGRGAIGVFRSYAEARFIIGSPIAAPLAIAYFQAREALGQGLRYLLSLIYFIVVMGLGQIGPVATLADVIIVTGVMTTAAAIVVPRRLLSRRAGMACVVAGFPLGLLAIAPALRDAIVQLHAPAAIAKPILAFVPAWHPGRILLEPNAGAIAIVLALAATAIGIVASAGRDLYPELYALAIARIERRERMRSRFSRPAVPTSRVTVPRARSLPAPAGVFVFIWKSVLEFRRVTQPFYLMLTIALVGAAGFISGRFMRADNVLFATICGLTVNVLLLFGVTAMTALAGELRRPLFWLSPATVFERLSALGVAQMWRAIATIEIVAVGFSLGGGTIAQVLILAIGLPALVALLGAVGFAAFALFPSAADARGPLVLLRFIICIAATVPPLVLFGIGLATLGSPIIALLCAALLALIEAGAFIGLAAWRLDARVDRLV